MSEEIVDYGDDADRPKKKPVPEPEIVSMAGAGSATPQSIQRATKKAMDPIAALRAVTEAHSPEEMTKLLRQAADFAVEQKSWMGLLEVLRLEVEYAVGKPVQRSVSASLTPEDFGDMFKD